MQNSTELDHGWEQQNPIVRSKESKCWNIAKLLAEHHFTGSEHFSEVVFMVEQPHRQLFTTEHPSSTGALMVNCILSGLLCLSYSIHQSTDDGGSYK